MMVFCVHCQKKQSIKDRYTAKTKRGKYLMKGICNECGGKVSSLISNKLYNEETFDQPSIV